MKSSSLDLARSTGATNPTEIGATARLWNLRMDGSPAVAFAAALTGADESFISDAATLSVAASSEAGELLANMALLARTLTSTIETASERCVHSVRGPIQWAETITARANALGNEDVYVCVTSVRSLDTIENRVLGASLRMLRRAGHLVESEAASDLTEEERLLIERRSRLAHWWLDVTGLAKIAPKRVTAKEISQFRRSRRLSRLHAVVAFRKRQSQGLEPSYVSGLCDPWTTNYHQFVISIISAVNDFDSVPERFSCVEGVISGGPITFRHPAVKCTSTPGLTFRGIPILPAEKLLNGAPWAGDLPVKGFRVRTDADLQRLMQHLGLERRSRRRS